MFAASLFLAFAAASAYADQAEARGAWGEVFAAIHRRSRQREAHQRDLQHIIDRFREHWPDRIGEKPLYYCESGGSVFFASEIAEGSDEARSALDRLRRALAVLDDLHDIDLVVAAGEIPLMLGIYSHDAERMKAKSAPVDWFVLVGPALVAELVREAALEAYERASAQPQMDSCALLVGLAVAHHSAVGRFARDEQHLALVHVAAFRADGAHPPLSRMGGSRQRLAVGKSV